MKKLKKGSFFKNPNDIFDGSLTNGANSVRQFRIAMIAHDIVFARFKNNRSSHRIANDALMMRRKFFNLFSFFIKGSIL